MGRIGRTYPRHDFGPAFTLPSAPQRLIFARRGTAHPALLWLSGFVCLLLLAWPSI